MTDTANRDTFAHDVWLYIDQDGAVCACDDNDDHEGRIEESGLSGTIVGYRVTIKGLVPLPRPQAAVDAGTVETNEAQAFDAASAEVVS